MYVLWKYKVLIWFIFILSGIFGEFLVSFILLRIIIEIFCFKLMFFWNWVYWWNVLIIFFGLDNGLYWNDIIFIWNRLLFVLLLYKKIFKLKFFKKVKLYMYISMIRYVFLKRYIGVFFYNKIKY